MSVAPSTVRGRAPDRSSVLERAVFELEGVAARSWPAREQVHDDGWVLRASSGWTKRANSALPLASAGMDPGVARRIARWYADRDLRPTIVVLPSMLPWAQRLPEGWAAVGAPVEVMVADVRAVDVRAASRGDLPELEVAPHPSRRWLDIYRGGRLPDHALDVLCGGAARFASVRHDGEVAGIVRFVVEPPWVGISAMEIVPSHRRRGLGVHLLRSALASAVASGAERAWLQVERDNVPACRLYRQAGFSTHHVYRYFALTDDGDDT